MCHYIVTIFSKEADKMTRWNPPRLHTELAKRSPLGDKFPAPLLNPSALALDA